MNQQEKGIAEIPELYTTSKHDIKKMKKDDREEVNILGNVFSSVYTKEPEWTWTLDEEENPASEKS